MMLEMQTPQGNPWVTGRTAELSGQYPLVISLGSLPAEGGEEQLPAPLTLSFGVTDGIVNGYVVLPLTPQQLLEVFTRMKHLIPSPAMNQ
jgi:hypothetical protein